MSKICTKCGLEKDAGDFYKTKSWCILCIKEYNESYSKQYYQENKEKIKHRSEEFRRCWALENLRPLKAIDNLSKGNKVEDESFA
jgi:hypothetical protein